MIFVTVGTHEQPFNRIIEAVDKLKENNIIKDDVFVQTGYSTYIPKHCDFEKFLTYDQMEFYAKESDIMITHGGPASIFLAYKYKKKPIVIPRDSKFKEHVDNHQILFSNRISNKIIRLTDVENLEECIEIARKTSYIQESSNNAFFCKELLKLVEK